jgi:cation diffusion facilitator family transporter
MADDSRLAIAASIAANVLIAATKFTAAAVTGSSAMFAEGIHSLVDSADGTLLFIGKHQSRKPPDAAHPAGHARDLYFWSLMVAMVFFAVGGGVSVVEGIQRTMHPEPVRDVHWNYIVLGIATLFDGTSWIIAFRQFRKRAHGRGIIDEFRQSKDPTLYTVLLEDTADLTGIVLAFLGVYFGERFRMPALDGIASIGVGVVLSIVALLLITQTKSLLVGEGADPSVVAEIRRCVADESAILTATYPLTVHLGPHEIFVAIAAEFRHELRADAITAAVARVEADIRRAAPDVRHIYVEAASLRGADQSRTM